MAAQQCKIIGSAVVLHCISTNSLSLKPLQSITHSDIHNISISLQVGIQCPNFHPWAMHLLLVYLHSLHVMATLLVRYQTINTMVTLINLRYCPNGFHIMKINKCTVIKVAIATPLMFKDMHIEPGHVNDDTSHQHTPRSFIISMVTSGT